MIRLTDIGGRDTSKADLDDHNLPSIFSYRQAYFVGAEAQLKKVVEWLQSSSMDAHTTVFQVSTKDWQSLLKEVE